ncbi:hypothetical protein PTI98_005446 [Pleurotus ostreatus]|nr:hypothetical protein PTI98_005446 [Pleurotus ostreatus]
MSLTDSISVFSEGTFEEQVRESMLRALQILNVPKIQELVNYIVRGRSEEERGEAIRPFQVALKTQDGAELDLARRQKVLSMVLADVKGLGDGTDREATQHVSTLIETIVGASTDAPSIKYRIITNLFNIVDRRSPLRLTAYNALLDLAIQRDELSIVQPNKENIDRWLSEWDVSSEQKSQLLKKISDAYQQAGDPTTSYEYLLSYVRSIPPSSPDSQPAAVEAIATALRLPSTFDFDSLSKLEGVVAAKDHEIYGLLQIFLGGGLSDYLSWEASHADVFEKYNLDKSQLTRKIRLLSLASMAFQHVGRDLPYAKISETIQVEPTEVEKWAIDVIRVGLISGKLSQTTQTMHIIRSTPRTFENEQWQLLEKRLVAWKTGLASVLEVISNARGGAPTQAAA